MKTKVMIIGTGPYGISIANALHEKEIPFVIAGQPFSLWYHHTLDSMAIRSDWHTSEIYSSKGTYDFRKFLQLQYPEKALEILKSRIPIDVFRTYLHYVQASLPYPVIQNEVIQLEKTGELFQTRMQSGEIVESQAVVIATGIGKHIYLPECLESLPKEKVLHAYHTEKLSAWKRKKILIVGVGQSAAENIAQLRRDNEITWILKREPIFYSEPLNLPVPVFKFILKISPFFYFLPNKFRKKFGSQYVIATITPDLKEEVMNKEVKRIYKTVEELELVSQADKLYSKTLDEEYDGMIAATGYHYDIKNLSFFSKQLLEKIATKDRVPKLDFNFQTSVKNLFIVGGMAEPAYGPAQRFIMGSSHASVRIGKVAERI